MTKTQAQRVAVALWGQGAIGLICRLVELHPNDFCIIGDANQGGGQDRLHGAIKIADGHISHKYEAQWHNWNGDGADQSFWLPDAFTVRHEQDHANDTD